MHEDTIVVKRALQTGAFGYVTKASAPNVLVEAVPFDRARQKGQITGTFGMEI
jgi:DNA-binding NarL/FixJ family response regulator